MIYRRARIEDVEAISNLIETYAAIDLMLKRPKALLYERLREFIIVENQDEIIAVGALTIIWKDLAEVRSLAVKDTYKGQGLGKSVVEKLVEEARELGIEKVFALTYQADFFSKLGFVVTEKETMPQKVWKDCINCHKFPNCDETAMIKVLN